jgi:predicted ATPase
LLSALNEEVPLQTRKLLHDTFDLLEQMIPLDAIYLDLASHIRPAVTTEEGDIRISTLEALATQILASIGKNTNAGQRFLDMLATIEPFSLHTEIAKVIAARLKCIIPM